MTTHDAMLLPPTSPSSTLSPTSHSHPSTTSTFLTDVGLASSASASGIAAVGEQQQQQVVQQVQSGQMEMGARPPAVPSDPPAPVLSPEEQYPLYEVEEIDAPIILGEGEGFIMSKEEKEKVEERGEEGHW